MTRSLLPFAALLALGSPVMAQEETAAPSPNQIVEEAAREEWVAIAPEDLLVMTLAPAADGTEREVVIQLMPAPFSQGWVENIRTLARAGWYDGITVNRVQDNYVVQWGDPNYDNPEAEGAAKPLPEGLRTMSEGDYVDSARVVESDKDTIVLRHPKHDLVDSYADSASFSEGWPIGIEIAEKGKVLRRWPVHCYGMVGVGRGYSPDTGSGAELYTVIGHAPRHLDRNIALVGRVVEGMEHLSSLPRGSGALGFYTAEEAGKRTPILSVRVASDLPEGDPALSSEAVGQQTRPAFEYLSTESETFARYADARANRRDPFFIHPAGGADICNIPVPVRRVAD
ncbi:MAG: peptidylprolyl isomerase [Qipengyuania sp.]